VWQGGTIYAYLRLALSVRLPTGRGARGRPTRRDQRRCAVRMACRRATKNHAKSAYRCALQATCHELAPLGRTWGAARTAAKECAILRPAFLWMVALVPLHI
jgi:hypothetical protein